MLIKFAAAFTTLAAVLIAPYALAQTVGTSDLENGAVTKAKLAKTGTRRTQARPNRYCHSDKRKSGAVTLENGEKYFRRSNGPPLRFSALHQTQAQAPGKTAVHGGKARGIEQAST